MTDIDLHALMAVIDDGRHDDPAEALPWAVLDGLLDLIPCDFVGFMEYDSAHKVFLTEQWNEGDGERVMDLDNHDPDNPYWDLWYDFLPCSYAERTGDLARLIDVADFYTPAELRSTPFVSELSGCDEPFVHRISVSMPTAPGLTRRILMDRKSGPAFSDRDRLVLQLLRPHLYEVYLDAQRRRDGVPRLSSRELQVLGLSAQGRSNSEIAHELFISVGTVRKHMEHVFDRTGVRSRAAAAALVLPQLSFAEPAGPKR